MHSNGIPSESLVEQYIEIFADAIAQEFQLPAREALRRINYELSGNPLTRNMRLRLRDLAHELQVRPSDAALLP